MEYGPRAPRPSTLDPLIEARLTDYPQLSAARLFREIQAEGFAGGYGQVKRYVRKAKQEILGGQRPGKTGQTIDGSTILVTSATEKEEDG